MSENKEEGRGKEFAVNYLDSNRGKLPDDRIGLLLSRIEKMSESELAAISSFTFKSPVIAILLSVFFGMIGVDRFYIGNVGLGVAKLITLGGCGVWWLVDLFLIMGKTKNQNYDKLSNGLMVLR